MSRREYILEELEKQDLLVDVNADDIAKEAKLSWIKRVLFRVVWPIVKPIIAQKINSKLVDFIDSIIGII